MGKKVKIAKGILTVIGTAYPLAKIALRAILNKNL